ncbi:MAG: acyltransferase [Clostridia bacterium]|nr:acyltransferase [Clostridia bacterium]
MVNDLTLEGIDTHTCYISEVKKEKTREINMELFRILSMFFVVMTHCMMHSEVIAKLGIQDSNFVMVQILKSISWMCNTCFILITGYYMVNSKFKIKRIAALWGKTILYTVGIYITIRVVLHTDHDMFKSIFPITHGQYWFITNYIALYFLSPILNMLIKKLNQNQFKYLITVMTVLYGLIGPAFGSFVGSLGNMIYIYFVGAYIRKYVEIKKEKQYYLLKCALFIIVAIFLRMVFNGLSLAIQSEAIKGELTRLLNSLNNFMNIITVTSAVFLFLKFRTIEIKGKTISKIISAVSTSTMAVYIIHEHSTVRVLIWYILVDFGKYAQSIYLAPRIILISAIIFIGCTLIDLIRIAIYSILKKIPCVKCLVDKINIYMDKVNKKVVKMIE